MKSVRDTPVQSALVLAALTLHVSLREPRSARQSTGLSNPGYLHRRCHSLTANLTRVPILSSVILSSRPLWGKETVFAALGTRSPRVAPRALARSRSVAWTSWLRHGSEKKRAVRWGAHRSLYVP